MFINTIYKSKTIKVHLENNARSGKLVKLRRDSLKENSGRYNNKIFYKINAGELDKFNLSISVKEKGDKGNAILNNEKI